MKGCNKNPGRKRGERTAKKRQRGRLGAKKVEADLVKKVKNIPLIPKPRKHPGGKKGGTQRICAKAKKVSEGLETNNHRREVMGPL